VGLLDNPHPRACLAIPRELTCRMPFWNMTVREAIHEKGTYAKLSLNNPELIDDQLLDAMLAIPILINRPFVIAIMSTRFSRSSKIVLDILSVNAF
jgi:arsenate reductase (glutaredoxin)